MTRSSPSFMNGVPELLLLQLIAEEELYGYEIVRRVKLRTQEHIKLGEGVVYPILHSLESAGFLKTKTRLVQGRNRVYYGITAKGQKRLLRIKGEWNRVNSAISLVFGAATDEH